MKLTDLLKFEEELRLDKKTVIILRWIALIGQLITIYAVHFYVGFQLPLIFCSLTIFFGGITNIFIQLDIFMEKKNTTTNNVTKGKISAQVKELTQESFDAFIYSAVTNAIIGIIFILMFSFS